MTQGEVNDPLPLRLNCDNIRPTVIQFRDLLPGFSQTSRYQFRRADNVPLAEYQMRELHKQSIGKDYLVHREKTSEHYRQIPWTQLSIPIAVQAVEYDRRITKPRLVKTLYGKYDDDLYKTEERISLCPLCQVERDTTEHLYSCSHLDAIAMVNVANISQQRIPIPPEIYECDGISAATATQLKDTIIRIVNTDSQTRIGMFNLLQQDEIIAVIPKLLGRDDSVLLLTVISRFIIQLVQPSISATLGMIELRNKCKKALEKFQPVRAAEEKKTRKHEPGNPFALLFHEEPEYVKPDPILSYDISYGSPQVTTQIVCGENT